ncbi:hypothetical protein PUN28_015639 [Cardiocondyla obscurior]|uniref:Uncharacterized protein n=1 Tax=Cardiocondyla obscurior TaxID=286306 RepID=A0AAW2EZ32_9HYME
MERSGLSRCTHEISCISRCDDNSGGTLGGGTVITGLNDGYSYEKREEDAVSVFRVTASTDQENAEGVFKQYQNTYQY